MGKIDKSTMLEWLRWILILPGSIISAILITFPIHWVVVLIQLTHKRGDTIEVDSLTGLLACIPPEMLEHFGDALFVPMILIIAGAKIAPRFKFQTGITIAILDGILCGFFIGTFYSENLRNDMSRLQWTITIILWVVAIACGLYFAHKESLRKETTVSSESSESIYS